MRIGSLFSGYGGLDLAVEQFFGGTTAWHVEFDKHPSAILARRWPGVPNHGDITTVDWAAVEPVDILTGGYPCQPFSHAGNRKGHADERHLWPYVKDALRVLRPRCGIFENVAGHLSLGFDTVLADLAEIGFDAEWVVVRASDAGAPHRRERLFIVARDADDRRRGQRLRAGERVAAVAGDGGGSRAQDGDLTLLPPTPSVNDMGRGKTPQDWDEWTQSMRERHGNGNGHGKSLHIEAQRLLPTPKASDGPNGGPGMRSGRGVADALPGVVGQLLPTPTARDWKDGATDPDAVPVNGLLGRAVWHIEPTEGDADATSVCEARPGEVLPGLRGADASETVQRPTRGHDEVPKSQDVQPVMRQHQADGEEGHAALAGTEAPETELPDVRGGERPTRSPHRSRSGEQRPGQPDDALLVVSPETALAGGSREADAGSSEGFCDGCSQWGPYAAAIHRWEIRLGRLAPPPTEPSGKDGRHRLSPRAVEHMMGLPDGWVTGVGIPRSAQLKALGNGVVPQQAALALSILIPRLGGAS